MPKPIGKGRRRTKRTYLGSGAGSLRSGTGATAKAKKPKSKIRKRTEEIFREYRSIPKPEGRKFRPITPKSPASGVDRPFFRSYAESQKPLRKRMATTMRKKAKR